MSEDNRTPIEVALAAFAWTQFLAIITVVDEADRSRLGELLSQFTPSHIDKPFDYSTLGSSAIALNIAAVCFFTLPVVIHLAGRKPGEDAPARLKVIAQLPGLLGYLSWVGSLASFLAYLSPSFLWFAVLPLALGAGVITLTEKGKKTKG